jgi:hypothetical protein
MALYVHEANIIVESSSVKCNLLTNHRSSIACFQGQLCNDAIDY